jgi:hypothetical protein
MISDQLTNCINHTGWETNWKPTCAFATEQNDYCQFVSKKSKALLVEEMFKISKRCKETNAVVRNNF